MRFCDLIPFFFRDCGVWGIVLSFFHPLLQALAEMEGNVYE